MDLASIRARSTDFLKKYRYVGIILIVGLVLMILPTSNKTKTSTAVEEDTQQTISASDALAEILAKIEGAGKVQVLLSIEQGEEILYQTDDDISQSLENTTSRTDTVIITDSDRNQSGLIKQKNPPKYQGAIVVCQGAESASVRLAIIKAVSDITGLRTDKISVLKMK